jgi:uncharacterized Zn finger protein
VVDLQVKPGEVAARVSGSSLYTVKVEVKALPGPRWQAVCADCSGAIDSLVELLQGRFSQGVMERLCRPDTGLFPSPKEIAFECSCPDWASMCKHVAAVLYGVGARLDQRPELLFLLRRVDQQELVARAGRDLPLSKHAPQREKVLAGADLSELFGLELSDAREAPAPPRAPAPSKKRAAAPRPKPTPARKTKGKSKTSAKARTPRSRPGATPAAPASSTESMRARKRTGARG